MSRNIRTHTYVYIHTHIPIYIYICMQVSTGMWNSYTKSTSVSYSITYDVMCGKKLFNIWLAFRILGLEMNFDNFIGVTSILCWYIGNFKFAFRYKTG